MLKKAAIFLIGNAKTRLYLEPLEKGTAKCILAILKSNDAWQINLECKAKTVIIISVSYHLFRTF